MINPRLTDEFDLAFTQADVPFAIPRHIDLPLCIDPFLLWASKDKHTQSLHGGFVSFFDAVRRQVLEGNTPGAARLLLKCREAREIGLGYGQADKRGVGIGPQLASAIVEAIHAVPQMEKATPDHIEVLQLLVPGLKEDRISDLAAFVLRAELVRLTEQYARRWSIPTRTVFIPDAWDHESHRVVAAVKGELPYQKSNGEPVLLVPLAWLRHLPWINYEDYYRSFYAAHVLPPGRAVNRVAKTDVLAYNRDNYKQVEAYVRLKETSVSQCFPQYSFERLSTHLQRNVIKNIAKTPTGIKDGADKAFESDCFELLRSAFYPELDFADNQVRTIDGVHVRDIIFHNDARTEWLRLLRDEYGCRQLVFELKNVAALGTDHIDQLYRYLGGDFGRLGFLVSRRPPPVNVKRNIMALYAAKRAAIVCLCDADLELAVAAQEASQAGVAVLKKAFLEFQRSVLV